MSSNQSDLSRRKFFASAAATGTAMTAATLIPALGAQAATGPVPKKWDRQADIVVIGYGAAGAAAAIVAADAGAKVLMIEKAPKGREGGNSRCSGNLFFNPTPADKAIAYQKAMNKGMVVPDEYLAVWAEEMGKNVEWIKSIGGNPSLAQPQSAFCSPEFPDFPGAEASKTYFATPGGWGGGRTWKVIAAAVESRAGIEVLYATAAKELVQNPTNGEILGVVAREGDKTLHIKARRAVVMTLGGFEFNPQMMRDYLGVADVAPFGTPYNTGDGIPMAQKVGADMWHMSAQSGMFAGVKLPNSPCGLITFQGVARVDGKPVGSHIQIDGDGNRYIMEGEPSHHGYVNLNSVWRPTPMPAAAWVVLDETTRTKAGSPWGFQRVMGWASQMDGYKPSKDMVDEIASGMVIRGETISELAGKIGVKPENLEKTIARWNSLCEKGEDSDFHRPAADLGPIRQGPFFAYRLTLGILNTQGGARRNVKAQVVDPDSKPIPRLYSAGEFGSMYSYLYNGGGNLGECLAFGRIAGRNAASEKALG